MNETGGLYSGAVSLVVVFVCAYDKQPVRIKQGSMCLPHHHHHDCIFIIVICMNLMHVVLCHPFEGNDKFLQLEGAAGWSLKCGYLV